MTGDTVAALKLFNEKAEKLLQSSFARDLRASGVKIQFDINNKTGTIKRTGPQGESFDAFILTYRYFIQDNEPCSIRNLSKIYEADGVPEELKTRFMASRTNLNQFLDRYSGNTINQKNVTWRELQDVFVNGGYSHSNKKEVFDSWMKIQGMNEMLVNDFVYVTGNMLNFIDYIRNVNVALLAHMEKQQDG
jgi:hypothetical protein